MAARIQPQTLYKPEYCEAVIRHCEQGGSIATFGPTIGVVRRAVYNWKAAHPEFAEACEIAIGKAAFEDEKVLHQLVTAGDKDRRLGAVLYRLGNRLPDVWRNVQKTEISGPNGGPVDNAITVTFVRPAAKADEGA